MKRKFLLGLSSAVSTASLACFYAMSTFAEDSTTSGSETASSSGGLLTFVLPLILMFVLLYFMAIRPQKKQEKEAKEMQESIQVGDEIVTNGGIVGMVVRIGDDNVVMETGGERNKLRVKKWAITENVSAAERARQAQAKSKSPVEAAAVSDDDDKKKKKSKKSEDSVEE